VAKRAYGTGSLRVVRNSWVGLWYGPDGRRVKRTLGAVRSPGSKEGLTKAQAERALRQIREQERELVRPGESPWRRPAPSSCSVSS
jgi:hypothetical protein